MSEAVAIEWSADDLETVLDSLDDIDCVLFGDRSSAEHAPVIARIRSENPDIPILVYATQADEDAVSDALSAGADDYIERRDSAVQQQRLERRLERELQRYSAQRSSESENQKLVAQNRRFEVITENLPVVLFALDPDGTFTLSEGKGLETLGLDAGALVGTSVFEAYADNPDILEAIERALDGEAVQTTQAVGDLVFNTRYRPVWDDDGTLTSVIGISLDITEQKQYEAELERRKRQFEAVFNDPLLLVGLLDTDGTLRRVNDSAMELVDSDREELVGTPFPETEWWQHDPEQRANVREWITRAAGGEYVTFEATQRAPDGGELFVSGTIRPVTDEESEVTSLVVSARDITERKKRKQQLEESNKRLEQFAYVASHDLQEPLRTVSNYTALIAEEYGDELDAEADRLIDVVVTGTERMQSMINGLLDYSRVTTRGEEFEAVDTGEIVEAVVDDLGVALEVHNGMVEWDDLPTVNADRNQLSQLFQNLIKNALEHSEDGPVEIVIRAREQGDDYRFEVEDNGPGIEENRHERIFRIFKSSEQYQTSSQAKGLGLAICDNIVQRHDGTIWVESESGRGSTFVFTIPKTGTD